MVRMPAASSAGTRSISSLTMDLDLTIVCAPAVLRDAQNDAARFGRRRAPSALARRAPGQRLKLDEQLIEPGEGIVLDIATKIAQRLELVELRMRVRPRSPGCARRRHRAQSLAPDCRARRATWPQRLRARKRSSSSSAMPSEHLGDMKDRRLEAGAMNLAFDIEKASDIAGDDAIGLGRGNVVEPCLRQCGRRSPDISRKTPRRTRSRLRPRCISVSSRPSTEREKGARLGLDAELAQARAGIVIGCARRIACTDDIGLGDVSKKAGDLEGTRGPDLRRGGDPRSRSRTGPECGT